MTLQVLADAKRLWDYHRLEQSVGQADVIVGLGSYETAVPARCAELFAEGRAPWLLFSGGLVERAGLLKTVWRVPEAEMFRGLALAAGVPPHRILLEPRATNTGENLRFSRAVLRESGLPCRRLILVTKPAMERRVRATAQIELRAFDYTVAAPRVTFEEYTRDPERRELLIHLMAGDLQRIERYPALGFQAPETIPDEVMSAFQRLVAAGYDRHLIG